MLSLAAMLLLAFCLWRAARHGRHLNVTAYPCRHHDRTVCYQNMIMKPLVQKRTSREHGTDMNDLHFPHADAPIWRDVQAEKDMEDKIRLGVDNLFPFRRRRRK